MLPNPLQKQTPTVAANSNVKKHRYTVGYASTGERFARKQIQANAHCVLLYLAGLTSDLTKAARQALSTVKAPPTADIVGGRGQLITSRSGNDSLWDFAAKMRVLGLLDFAMARSDLGFVLSPKRLLAHCRDVSRNDLPAEIGKAHPRLTLAADEVLTTHLEL